MKPSDHPLFRLLRAAAAAPPPTEEGPVVVPSAHWLMQQRGRSERTMPSAVRLVLRGGLAVACLLFLVSSLLSARQIAQANRDVFAVPEAALTRLATP